ncbi:uncharacterized protein G2W53_016481 [Senna tora]|uniref:Uncharacterized protein n=1 Tax=Senna tora TaxID=362788 RepID=A0A834TPB6_9FABA|nr:uncharacterized protein G2W53_016481 [Senna tora]
MGREVKITNKWEEKTPAEEEKRSSGGEDTSVSTSRGREAQAFDEQR